MISVCFFSSSSLVRACGINNTFSFGIKYSAIICSTSAKSFLFSTTNLKFDFGDDGILLLDAAQVPNQISNDDAEANCTIEISLDNFKDMAEGKLDGTSAFMSGKLKIQGDMGVAMKLGPLLS